jgi:hypothetical protein
VSVEEPRRREREKKVMKRGRRVASAEAVRPIPGSTVDPVDGWLGLFGGERGREKTNRSRRPRWRRGNQRFR